MKELQRWFKLLFNRFKERMIKIGVDTLIFDEFEKIHTETEFTGDIADVLSEFIMWFPERNRLGIPYPDDMYNYAVLKKGAVNTRAKAPFSCLSVCDL